MIVSEQIEQAFYKTFHERHPEWVKNISGMIQDFINNNMVCDKIPARRYFSYGEAREIIANSNVTDLYVYLAESMVKLMNAINNYIWDNSLTISLDRNGRLFCPALSNNFPFYQEVEYICKKMIETPNVSVLFQTNPDLVKLAADIIQQNYQISLMQDKKIEKMVDGRFKDLDNVYYMQSIGRQSTKLPFGFERVDLFKKIEKNYKKLNGVTNIQVNYETRNRCLQDILNGSQLKNSHNEYKVGESLYVSQDVGKSRDQQQDAAIVLEHPQNKEFKIVAVADGMGGSGDGALSSGEITKELALWFSTLDPSLSNDYLTVVNLLSQKIQEISKNIYEKYNRTASINGQPATGATLTGAIVCDNETVILQIGDSRAYTVKNNKLSLQTIDESAPWLMNGYKNDVPSAEMVDRLRFKNNNNQILRFVGMDSVGVPQAHVIPNACYDRLILMSDGVSDLLSQEDIRVISSMNRKELVTQELINKALMSNAINPYYNNSMGDEKYMINAGKDNATAVMFSRR